MEYHSLDKRLTYLMMMVLVKQTEEYDMMLQMEKTGMLMLIAEIVVGDMTADDVDKLACSADVMKPRQARGEDCAQLIQESSCRVEGLEEFSGAFGLVPSKEKSTSFFGNVTEITRNNILKLLPFNEVLDWKSKVLSFAGRLQLISYVMSSMHVYWASVFVFPITVSSEIERLMKGFLWCHGTLQKGRAKVNWMENLGKDEGTSFAFGLHVPRLFDEVQFVGNLDLVQRYSKRGQGNNPRGGGEAGYGGAQNRVGNTNPDKMLLMQAQENGVALDEEQLLFLAGDCDAFDSDVDKAPTAQTMFMANLSSVDPVYDEAGPSYDSDILSEVHNHDHYQDAVCEHHEEHEIHDDVQPNHVVDSHADYTSDSNMIPYDQYVKDNTVPGVQSNVSSILNYAYMMIYNDMYEPHSQSVSKTSRNTVVDNLLTAELATYKEQVELYERRAWFELMEREQKIDEQLRIVITDRNFKEETLKKELHSIKLQLASTINHNKSMKKVEDRLYKQDQSLQTVHMLCKPKPYYNELNKVAVGYKNPLCITREKQVQPALYNGHEIIISNHVSAIVNNTEDTLEIAEITRRKMNDKMKDPKCMNHKVKIAPHDYSKENFLATFTPWNQLTPEQIFWSQDLIKMKVKGLKEQTTTSRPIKALTLLTKGEKSFVQTKECYLKELIPFFKTLKEHLKGIQKALTKEIKEMKDVFKELEAGVDQNVIDRKHDEIERKNLLIASDNLIVECLSKEVFYVATNYELNVFRFTEMHVAHTIVEARCLELEAELFNLRD
nr:hypothetical protein [Tanacetum cinerariifolium]